MLKKTLLSPIIDIFQFNNFGRSLRGEVNPRKFQNFGSLASTGGGVNPRISKF